MLHCQYLRHLQKYMSHFASDSGFRDLVDYHRKEIAIVVDIDIDPVIGVLNGLYCPSIHRDYRDPVEMLRSLLFMTVLKNRGITKWVAMTRKISFYAVMAGFDPGDVPGVGTYYDFMARIVDGPYHKLMPGEVRKSTFNAGEHRRNLKEEKHAGKDELNPHQSQSKKLVDQLLAQSNEPRPDGFGKTLDGLLMCLGVEPGIESGLIKNLQSLVVSGDGSILETGASPTGKPTCTCRREGVYKCDHDKIYTSPTAQWCYDHHHDCYVFGDRYYLLATSQSNHDLPLRIIMPGGNESDYTLSLKALDPIFKSIVENNKGIRIAVFIGDGHHDSYAHYEYLSNKGIIPIIPLSGNSDKVYPHLLEDKGIRLDTDGTPFCPAGVRMRHHQYEKNKQTHVYCCPVKRNTHRDGKSVYVAHIEQCPHKQDCAPESSLGPIVYIKSNDDPRLFPPIPRSTLRFKELAKQRTACERGNSLIDSYGPDGSSRNADRGLIRLTMACIAHHAVVRYKEAMEKTSSSQLLLQVLEKIGVRYPQKYQDTG